ncbi:MAG: hypothetical protein AAFU77_02465 [Myxococcota bacterium]
MNERRVRGDRWGRRGLIQSGLTRSLGAEAHFALAVAFEPVENGLCVNAL